MRESDGNAPSQGAVLKALAETNACLMVETLAEMTGLSRKLVVAAAGRLIIRGLVERRERGCLEVTPEGRRVVEAGEPLTGGPRGDLAEPRRVSRGTLRARAWAAIRIRRKFTLADLLQAATRGGEADAAGNIRRYLRALVAAGFLGEMRREKPTSPTSNGEKRYALIRDPGPIPPVVSARTGRIRGMEETI